VDDVQVEYMRKKTSKYGGAHGVRRAKLDREIEIGS
jgi:hypothetical protein